MSRKIVTTSRPTAARALARLAHALVFGFTAAAAPLALQAQTAPADPHTVRAGETLWSLAQRYLGDPLLWPEIYRMNTAVVEDPHWIYPGEVLQLAGAALAPSVPVADTPAPIADTAAMPVGVAAPAAAAEVPPGQGMAAAPGDPDPETQAPIFPMRGGNESMRQTLRAYVNQPYRPLRPSEFYAAGFLTEEQRLPFGRIIGRIVPQQVQSVSTRTTATLYTLIGIEAPEGGSYQVGDSLLLIDRSKEIPRFGRAVVPTGLARVTALEGGRYVATVIAVYGAIWTGQAVLPAEKFVDGGLRHAAPVTDGVRAVVIGWPARQELKAAQKFLYLDKGRRDGVTAGDIFEVRRTAGLRSDGALRVADLMATVQVVHVSEHTATAKLLQIVSPDIPAGTEARQVGKLPS